MARITRGHDVFGIKQLVRQLRHRDRLVRLAPPRGQRGGADGEEVETGEGDHVDGEFAEVGVELAGETQAGGDTRDDEGDEVVEVGVSWGGDFQGAEADVVEGFVVDAEGEVGVFDELVHGEGGVVGLDDGVGYLGRGHYREGAQHAVGEFFADLLGDMMGSDDGVSLQVGDGNLAAQRPMEAKRTEVYVP